MYHRGESVLIRRNTSLGSRNTSSWVTVHATHATGIARMNSQTICVPRGINAFVEASTNGKDAHAVRVKHHGLLG